MPVTDAFPVGLPCAEFDGRGAGGSDERVKGRASDRTSERKDERANVVVSGAREQSEQCGLCEKQAAWTDERMSEQSC